MYRLDDGARLDDFCHFLQALEVMALLAAVHGTALQREMLPCVQSLVRYGLKTLCGIDRMQALPGMLCRDAALMQRVGFHAPQVRQGVGQRGRTKRQGQRTPGPMGPDPLANHVGQCHVRDLEALCNGVMRALAKAGVFGKRVTGRAEGTDLETTERDQGWGQATRTRRSADQSGRVQAIEGTVYGGNVLLVIDAVTKMPLAVQVGQMQAHEARWTRALVTQAQAKLADHARLPKVVFAQGCLAGTALWWLDQRGSLVVVPAQTTMAVTIDAQAQAAAGEGVTVGRRVHTGRHGQGRTAWTARLDTAVGGLTGLTTYEPDGTEAHGRHHNRRDCAANPSQAVVVRQWQGQDSGPGGTTVFLTKAAVQQPLKPFDDDDDRSLMEHCCSKAAKPPWDVQHPPQKTARAVRVHVLFTRLLCALATAYRRPGEQEALGGELVGWQRWRRQLLAQTRDQVIVCAQGAYGIFHLAVCARRMGAKLKAVPPAIGTRRDILATYGLPPEG